MPQSEGGYLRSELGISRRDLLRRGALVGGTLLWAAPVIQSLAAPAYAATPVASCCECKRNNPVTGFQCGVDHFTCEQCKTFCGAPQNPVISYRNGNDCACEPRSNGKGKQCVPSPPSGTCVAQTCA
jgi:hypothetical protein